MVDPVAHATLQAANNRHTHLDPARSSLDPISVACSVAKPLFHLDLAYPPPTKSHHGRWKIRFASAVPDDGTNLCLSDELLPITGLPQKILRRQAIPLILQESLQCEYW